MPDQNKENLQDRLTRLEQRVQKLEQRLQEKSTTVSPEKVPQTKPETKEAVEKDQKRRLQVDQVRLGEEWLNRIGIGLLLVGVAFLFKYSIDQGWLIPPIRSAIGLAIGGVLFVGGLKMNSQDQPLKQILLGGGIATFYITGFATFQLYSFMPGFVIWSFMIVVTLLALSLSLQQDEAVLSIVGTLGALGTPFMLYSGDGSVQMLMVYLALVLAGASAVYMKKGWESLLWCIAGGGFVVLVVGVFDISTSSQSATLTQEWSLQIGAIIWILASWILPVMREVLNFNDPYDWPDPKIMLEDGTLDEKMSFRTSSSVHVMVFLIPLFALLHSHGVWDFSMDQAGITSIGLAAVGGAFFWPLRQQGVFKLASTHAFMGLVMLTIGIFLLLEGNFLFTVLLMEAVALRYIARQTGDTKIGVSSHILIGIGFYWLMSEVIYSTTELSLFTVDSVSQLAFIAASGLLIPKWLEKDDLKQIYQIATHILFLVWLYQKFSAFENGQALVTVLWGAYAILLLILGFSRYGKRVRLAGMATIFLVVGKLFLVDLSQLQAIWRILLFMGFGAVLLMLGYYSQSRWQDESDQT